MLTPRQLDLSETIGGGWVGWLAGGWLVGQQVGQLVVFFGFF